MSPTGFASPTSSTTATPWVPDLGDGTFRNPVLYADYSDPDAVRVGDDYWLTASSFSHAPGLPILHSRDLINWRIVNHALPQVPPADHYRAHRPGCGVWAPSIRYHAGKFWIFYGDPDFGIFVIHAEDPAGTWSEPHLLLGGRGLIDPSPLWREDGTAWFVHGWARSRSGINNRLTLRQMTPDAREVIGEGQVIINADEMPGWDTLEGPKFYQHNGYYWIFAPAGGVATGYQSVFRARDIRGPYEARIVLRQGDKPVNGPHQGAWVDTPGGEHWFMHFQELQPYGRIIHLQPVQWDANGWPVMGEAEPGAGYGTPVLVHPKPALPPMPVATPACTDLFQSPTLGLQWQWQANPEPTWAAINPEAGELGLRPAVWTQPNLGVAPHLLLQKFPAPSFTVHTRLRWQDAATGDQAGLLVFGYHYAWLGLEVTAHGYDLVFRVADATTEAPEQELARVNVPSDEVHLAFAVAEGGKVQFQWSLDGEDFQPIGTPFASRESRWVGAKFGLFASAAQVTTNGRAHFGAVRVC